MSKETETSKEQHYTGTVGRGRNSSKGLAIAIHCMPNIGGWILHWCEQELQVDKEDPDEHSTGYRGLKIPSLFLTTRRVGQSLAPKTNNSLYNQVGCKQFNIPNQWQATAKKHCHHTSLNIPQLNKELLSTTAGS